MRREPRPYQVTYWPETQEICVRGDPKLLGDLLQIDGARLVGGEHQDPGAFLAMPTTRLNVMAIEAASAIESASRQYIEARARTMTYDWSQVYAEWARQGIVIEGELMSHQVDACSVGTPRRALMHASEQGTGKTTAGWIQLLLWRSRRAVVFAPKSVCQEWMLEYKRLFPSSPALEAVMPDMDVGSRSKGTFIRGYRDHPRPIAIVVNYDVARTVLDDVIAFNPDTIICDESWRLKNRRAKVTRAVCQVADQCNHVALLTGTPVGNDIGDLWSQLRILLGPRFLGERTEQAAYDLFLNRMAAFTWLGQGEGRPRIRRPDGLADPVGLMRILQPIWYRASKATCLQLPPKRYRKVYLDLDPAMMKLYEDVEEQGEAALGAQLSLADERVVMIRLQQMAGGHVPTPVFPGSDDYVGLEEEVESVLTQDLTWRWQMEPAPCPKLQWIVQRAQDVWLGNPSQRVILWFRFRHEIDRFARALVEILSQERVFVADGRTSSLALDRAKREFNSRHPDGVQVICAQWKKLAYGHNLQAADEHVRVTHTWSFIEWAQAEDRSHRAGRQEPVNYTTLIARHTVDEVTIAALERKEDLHNLVSVPTHAAQIQ